MALVAAKGRSHSGQAVGIDSPPHPSATLLADEQTRIGQDLGVVGDRRLASVQRRLQITGADLGLGSDEREQWQPVPTAVEEQVSCCYAVQDKVWVKGPDGELWEIYAVLADAEMPVGELRAVEPSGAACSASRPDLAVGSPFPGGAASCC